MQKFVIFSLNFSTYIRFDASLIPQRAVTQHKRIAEDKDNKPTLDVFPSISSDIFSTYEGSSIRESTVSIFQQSDSSIQLEKDIDVKKCNFEKLRHICFLATRRSLMTEKSFHIVHPVASSIPASQHTVDTQWTFTREKEQSDGSQLKVKHSEPVQMKLGAITQTSLKTNDEDKNSADAPPIPPDGEY